jgi:hypothetical protein
MVQSALAQPASSSGKRQTQIRGTPKINEVRADSSVQGQAHHSGLNRRTRQCRQTLPEKIRSVWCWGSSRRTASTLHCMSLPMRSWPIFWACA